MTRRQAHERSLARARAKREARQRRERRRRRITVGIVGLVALLLVATLILTVFPPRGASPEVEDPTSALSQTAGDVACGGSRPEAAEREKRQYDAPEEVLEPAVDYRARIVTSCGTIVVDLHEGRAPKTTNSFVFLGREGFFDGTTFHRVEPGFVVQGGDPTGSGQGGPGYIVADELAMAREQGYPAGTLAMANSGPNTNGSQFFVTLEQPDGLLPNYTVFGRVVAGMDVVQRIGALPVHSDPGTGIRAPDETIYIEAVTIQDG